MAAVVFRPTNIKEPPLLERLRRAALERGAPEPQLLLGHESLETTMIYTHVARQGLRA